MFNCKSFFIKDILLSFIISGLITTTPGHPVQAAGINPDRYLNVKTKVTAFIKKEMKNRKVQGLSIALVDDQEVVWTEGFSWRVRPIA